MINNELFKIMQKFEKEWDWQLGSLMLKNESEGREWKKTIASYFFQKGCALGYNGYLLAQKEITDTMRLEWMIKNRVRIIDATARNLNPLFVAENDNRSLGDTYSSPRLAIDAAMKEEREK